MRIPVGQTHARVAERSAQALRHQPGAIARLARALIGLAGVLATGEITMGLEQVPIPAGDGPGVWLFVGDGLLLSSPCLGVIAFTVVLGIVLIWASIHLVRRRIEQEHQNNEQLRRQIEAESMHRVEQARRGAEARFRAMFENASVGMVHAHIDGTALAINDALVRLIGARDVQQVTKMANELPAMLFVNPQDIGQLNHEMAQQGRVDGYESQWRRLDGKLIWVRLVVNLQQPAEGEQPYHEVIVQDISEEKRTENIMLSRTQALELIAQNRPLPEVLGSVAHALCEQMDGASSGILLFENGQLKPACLEGLSQEFGQSLCDYAKDSTRLPTLSAWGSEPIVVTDASMPQGDDDLCKLLIEHGKISCWSAPILGGDGGVLGVVMMCFGAVSIPSATDLHLLLRRAAVVSLAVDHHRLCERLVSQLMHDSLTGLANRRMMDDEFRKVLSAAHQQGRRAALFYLDIDNFKVVNDTLGHHVGDLMIQQVAHRLGLAATQGVVVARMGGDEFAIILPDAPNSEYIEQWAQRFLDCFNGAFDADGRELVATATIGIAVYPDHGHDPTQLQRCADTAIHHAKRAGRHRYQFYSSEMDVYMMDRLDLEAKLRHAMELQQLHLAYQPQVDAKGKIIGLEALLRWIHPELGNISPGRFIPVAEQTGLIIPIGKWILWEACRQAKVWSDELGRPIRVAVNVSALQFAQADLLQNLRTALRETRLPAGQLELEVTESLVMDHGAMEKLVAIRRMGVCIALDDFGTGYSCLAYLHRMPIDTIKIDRSFVSDIVPTADSHCIHNSRPVVGAIVSMSQSLGMQVLAEGVETMAQRDLLVGMGCHAMQGWLYSAAMLPEQLLPLLKAGVIEPSQPKNKNVA